MPSEDAGNLRYLLHIKFNIETARIFAGDDYSVFCADLMRIYSVTRCLEIISEASRRLSSGFKARNSHVRWRAIAGAGNIYRHDYEDVAADRIWSTIGDELQVLLTCVEAEIARFDQNL